MEMQLSLQLYHAGVDPEEVPPDNTMPLLWIEQDNTLRIVELVNIDPFSMRYILGIYGSKITLNGLHSTGCNAQNATVYIWDTGNAINTSTRITHNSFCHSTTRALFVYHSNVTVANSVFHGLSIASFSRGAIFADNTDDSHMWISDCGFL